MQSDPIYWKGVRQSVLVTVFLAYIMNFTLQWMARQTKQQKISYRIRNLHFKVFIWGLSSVFGCNLFQSGVYEGFFSWIIFISLAMLHYLNFKDTEAQKRALADGFFYALIVAWFIIVILHNTINN